MNIDHQTLFRTLPNQRKGHRVPIAPLEPGTNETILNQIATTLLLFRSGQVMTQAAGVCYPQSDVLLEPESIGGHADFRRWSAVSYVCRRGFVKARYSHYDQVIAGPRSSCAPRNQCHAPVLWVR